MNISIILFFLTSISFSQNLRVEYDFTVNKSNELATATKQYVLEQSTTGSLFLFDKIREKKQFKNYELAEVVFDKDSIVAYIIGDNSIEFLYKEKHYKDFKNNLQFYNFKTGYTIKSICVKEPIEIFDWQIENSADTIIAGYSCQKAITTFRGREYEAYFTNELADQGGPWKFDGLPGFILKVASKDGYLLIEPTKIILNKNNIVIKNPYLGKKTITFAEIKDVILEQDIKTVKKMKSGPNPPDSVTIGEPDLIEKLHMGVRIYY